MGKNLPKKSTTVGSQVLLQRLVKKPGFGESLLGAPVRWVSPAPPDYAEYYDQDFLDCLEIQDQPVPLKDFWPRSGPRWDALGIGQDAGQTRILVEAKAYIEEADTDPTGAGETSRPLIEKSLQEAQTFMKATKARADWSRSFYQTANRFAHLYYLHELNQIPTELWFVCFYDNKDTRPTSAEEWRGALRLIHSHLGLGRKYPLKDRIRYLFVDSASLAPLP